MLFQIIAIGFTENQTEDNWQTTQTYLQLRYEAQWKAAVKRSHRKHMFPLKLAEEAFYTEKSVWQEGKCHCERYDIAHLVQCATPLEI